MMNHRRSKVLEVRRAAAHKARGVVWALVVGGLSAATATADETPNFAAPLDAASAQKADLESAPALILIADEAPNQQQQAADLMKRLGQVTQRLGQMEKTNLEPVWLLVPGLNSNIPSAYGGGKGTLGVGVGYQERTRYSQTDDGTAGVVVGFGDPEKIGADVQLTALDLSQFGRRASISVKLHRRLPNDYAVAVGVENLATRKFTDGGRSIYAVVSKKVRLKESSREPFSRLYLSGGVGNGRFRPEHIVARDTGSINVFGSAAINLSPWARLFTEWTGQALNVGFSLVPWRNLPIVITPALADVAGPGGDGTRFTLGVGYLIK